MTTAEPTWPYAVGDEAARVETLTPGIAPGTGTRSDPVPLKLNPARLPDPKAIPPRPWLYGTQLLRGFVTVLAAPGGTGKSAYAMAVGLAVATGREILSHRKPELRAKLHQVCNVAVVNLEDPQDELDRRLAALAIRYELDEEAIAGRYFIHSVETRPITIAAEAPDGFSVIYPDEDALIKEMTDNAIGLLIVDPFAESHSLEENSNPHMVAAAAAWRRVARKTGAAVWLIHHVRKGAATDIDAVRGAKGLTDSARIGLLMTPMTEEEAGRLGVPIAERRRYVRLDDAKANMAPMCDQARWFRHCGVALENGTPDYPRGDSVAAIETWEPPNPFDALSEAQANELLDIIDEGFAPGVPFAPTRAGKSNERWVGHAVLKYMGGSEAEAALVVSVWLKNGVLDEIEYRDKAEGKARKGVNVNATKRPGERK